MDFVIINLGTVARDKQTGRIFAKKPAGYDIFTHKSFLMESYFKILVWPVSLALSQGTLTRSFIYSYLRVMV
jgi:hypothetical protein